MTPKPKLYKKVNARKGDILTWKCWYNGESFDVGLRGAGYGYHFKGFWHGTYKTVRDAYDAFCKRPVVGNQGVIADTTEPLSLDDLDMAMF